MGHTEKKDFDEESKAQKVRFDLNELVFRSRSLLLSGEITSESVEKLNRQLLALEQDKANKPVSLFIDSPGGSVDAGFALFHMIRFISCPVYTIGLGLVASAGVLIYISVPKDRRLSFPHARFMLHQPMSGFQGVVTDIEIHAGELDRTKKELNFLIAEETSKTFKQIEKDTDRDFWLSSQEAVDYGLVDHIIRDRTDLNKRMRL